MGLLELRDVTAGYGPITVLRGLSLSVRRGEIVAILGANGSGKSTALKTAIGLTQITRGRVVFDGQDVTAWPGHRRAARGLGYVPQVQNVFLDLTVADNLRMGAYLQSRAWEAAVEEVLDLFPALIERRREVAKHLSGGERRILAIALTLLMRPRLLLLDEPSSDLAPAMVDTVFDAIRRIHVEHGLPIALVEQNVAHARAIAHRVCVLVRGHTALDVPAAELDLGHLHYLFLEGKIR
jgi:ABC-type branched-subunit amino acid transport system ATPase component